MNLTDFMTRAASTRSIARPRVGRLAESPHPSLRSVHPRPSPSFAYTPHSFQPDFSVCIALSSRTAQATAAARTRMMKAKEDLCGAKALLPPLNVTARQQLWINPTRALAA